MLDRLLTILRIYIVIRWCYQALGCRCGRERQRGSRKRWLRWLSCTQRGRGSSTRWLRWLSCTQRGRGSSPRWYQGKVVNRCRADLVRTVRKFAGIIKGTNKRFLHTSIDKNTVCSKTGRVSYQGYNTITFHSFNTSK